jgi:hypothetical protein
MCDISQRTHLINITALLSLISYHQQYHCIGTKVSTLYEEPAVTIRLNISLKSVQLLFKSFRDKN